MTRPAVLVHNTLPGNAVVCKQPVILLSGAHMHVDHSTVPALAALRKSNVNSNTMRAGVPAAVAATAPPCCAHPAAQCCPCASQRTPPPPGHSEGPAPTGSTGTVTVTLPTLQLPLLYACQSPHTDGSKYLTLTLALALPVQISSGNPWSGSPSDSLKLGPAGCFKVQ